MKGYYDEVDQLALATLNESGLKITKPIAIKFARLFLLKLKKHNAEMPEMYYVLKSLGVNDG